VSVGGRQVRDLMFWFPPLDTAAVTVSFVTYAGQLYMTVAADRSVLPDPDFVTTDFVAEVRTSRRIGNTILVDLWMFHLFVGSPPGRFAPPPPHVIK